MPCRDRRCCFEALESRALLTTTAGPDYETLAQSGTRQELLADALAQVPIDASVYTLPGDGTWQVDLPDAGTLSLRKTDAAGKLAADSPGIINIGAAPTTSTSLVVRGQDNLDDTLSLNFATLPRLPDGTLAIDTIVYHGGSAGFDTLEVKGGTFHEVVYTVTGKDSGILQYQLEDDPEKKNLLTVVFTGLEPVIDVTTAASITVIANATADDIYVSDGAGYEGDDTIRVHENEDAFEDIAFANKTSLYLDADGGNDTIHLEFTQYATGLEWIAVFGSDGDDVIHGSAFDDSELDGGDGADIVYGHDGADFLYGYDGADILDGGDGDDWLYGAAGDDILIGGAGDDFYEFVSGNNGSDTITEAANADTDTLNFGWLSSAVDVDLADTTPQIIVAGSVTLTLSDETGIENVIGGSGNDIMVGNTRDNRLEGGAGTDTLTGGDGDDTLLGGDATDTLSGGAADDTLSGNAGDDTLSGDSGDDTLTGSTGNDTLEGGFGSDIYVYASGSNGTDTINEDADADSDTLDFRALTSALIVSLANASSQTVLSGSVVIDLSNDTAIENVIGGTAGDTITGNTRDNILEGRGGNDGLTGGTGSDTYVFDTAAGSLGSDTVTEAADLDSDTLDLSSLTTGFTLSLASTSAQNLTAVTITLSHATGVENVIAGSGADTLTGNARNNFLRGGSGNDTVSAGDGDDTLMGDAGNDGLTGGDGDDVYVFDPLAGNLGTDTVTEGANLDSDTLDLSNFADDEGFSLDLGSTSSQTIVSGVLVVSLSSTSGIENVIAGSGNDTITGNARDNILDGRAGDDLLIGNDGLDRLYGSWGEDELRGNAGSDALYGGEDDDELWGGTGDDFLHGQEGDDDLSDHTSGSSSTEGGNDHLDGGFGNDTLRGYSGDDRMIGGAGDDDLYGGTNDDTYAYLWKLGDYGLGADVIHEAASSGTDKLDFAKFYADDYVEPDPSASGEQFVSEQEASDPIVYDEEQTLRELLSIEFATTNTVEDSDSPVTSK